MRNRRDFSSSSFDYDPYIEREDADPRVGLVNLADVMLVFACGLMVALVVHFNVDLPSFNEVTATDAMSELSEDQIEDLAKSADGTGTLYREKGVVYEDPTTGKLYLLSEEDIALAEATSDKGADDTSWGGDENSNGSSDSNGSNASRPSSGTGGSGNAGSSGSGSNAASGNN